MTLRSGITTGHLRGGRGQGGGHGARRRRRARRPSTSRCPADKPSAWRRLRAARRPTAAAAAAVRKDAGDDPDVTDGMEIVVARLAWSGGDGRDVRGRRRRGHGHQAGAAGPAGRAGHQSRPPPNDRRRRAGGDAADGVRVEISIPGGREVARRTFNPRLGIEGGLSILGTTGIVRPYCSRALQMPCDARSTWPPPAASAARCWFRATSAPRRPARHFPSPTSSASRSATPGASPLDLLLAGAQPSRPSCWSAIPASWPSWPRGNGTRTRRARRPAAAAVARLARRDRSVGRPWRVRRSRASSPPCCRAERTLLADALAERIRAIRPPANLRPPRGTRLSRRRAVWWTWPGRGWAPRETSPDGNEPSANCRRRLRTGRGRATDRRRAPGDRRGRRVGRQPAIARPLATSAGQRERPSRATLPRRWRRSKRIAPPDAAWPCSSAAIRACSASPGCVAERFGRANCRIIPGISAVQAGLRPAGPRLERRAHPQRPRPDAAGRRRGASPLRQVGDSRRRGAKGGNGSPARPRVLEETHEAYPLRKPLPGRRADSADDARGTGRRRRRLALPGPSSCGGRCSR